MKKNLISFIFLFYTIVLIFLNSSIIYAQWVKVAEGNPWCFAYDGTFIYAGLAGGIYIPGDTTAPHNIIRSSDDGASWVNISNGLSSGSVYSLSVYALAIKGSNLFAGTDNGIFISSDHGDNWTRLNFDPANGEVHGFFVDNNIILAGADAGQYACDDSLGGVFRSSDDGKTWVRSSLGISDNCWYKRVYTFTKIGSIIFEGSMDGGVAYSNDIGLHWTHLSGSGWCCMVVSFDSTLWGAPIGPIYRSTNMGLDWIRCDSGLTNPGTYSYYYVMSLAVSQSRGGCIILLAGVEIYGVYVSKDMGNSWKSVTDNLGIVAYSSDVFSLSVIGDFVVAGTGNGLWRRPFSEITSINKDQFKLSPEFKLEQNYPNPFNPSTVISWQLAVDNFVILNVYDVLGRVVKTLVNQQQTAGIHSVTFNAAKLPSGIYYYSLTTGNNTAVKKMCLIR